MGMTKQILYPNHLKTTIHMGMSVVQKNTSPIDYSPIYNIIYLTM